MGYISKDELRDIEENLCSEANIKIYKDCYKKTRNNCVNCCSNTCECVIQVSSLFFTGLVSAFNFMFE